ncbi:ABC-type transport system involved in multi-copper enzyme maturation permease subunit [Paenibacillus forsythiae]|uniref:ABC-type transport system involved in multi-copper enzyme maturation permease subunit n=1 Tax=Paenibacillus forsythiae TaxID=365616 RepID=A0ABU3H349_9BACL|nr:ABC transporter permease [Paenibacillus forsythiae]MDT3425239.1 ABC-type transport system involved in multi-copper enzyme maturation permease subunit [Paenibacillus forsythiae]
MRKLISLEIRKHKLAGMLKGALITNLGILAFMILVVFIDRSELETYSDVFEALYLFIRAAFIIFASVLLSKLIIDEYKNNTITLLFTYPISRMKLMYAKLIIVLLFTFLNIIVSNITLGAIIVGINSFANAIPGEITADLLISELIKTGASAVYAAGIGLIPLYVGMRKKSVPATIVSGVLIVALISSGFGEFRLGELAFVSVSLGLLGMAIAFQSIRRVERDDIA